MSSPLPPGLSLGSSLGLCTAGSTSPLQRHSAASPDPAIEPAARLNNIPIIAFSHLGWDWVWQRPQQFLSRLAKKRRLLFVETYCSDSDVSYRRIRSAKGHPSITIFESHLPRARWSDGAFIDAERRRLLQEALAGDLRGQFDEPILWFYDPMAVTAFAEQLNERLIVYDCMDELSQFKGAPPELQARERTLLRAAHVVFCGGRKMREKRLPLNANCHFYGTGVDCDHFGRARSSELMVDADIAALPGPVLGYFGVVDERIDYELLAQLADARSDWSIAMVGPVAKVDPSTFPRRPNLHFLGGRPYGQLPAITKGFSVCLMPFALNAATEYINPTKALEYMATARPIVSTALDEVRMNFSRVCRIAGDRDEFVELCQQEAATPSPRRIDEGLRLAEENTWDRIAAKMEDHMQEALQARSAHSVTTAASLLPIRRKRVAYV